MWEIESQSIRVANGYISYYYLLEVSRYLFFGGNRCYAPTENAQKEKNRVQFYKRKREKTKTKLKLQQIF